jgi:hypothetical protein
MSRSSVTVAETIDAPAVRACSLHVWLLVGSGVVAAAQIGKAIIFVPMIRDELAQRWASAPVASPAGWAFDDP